MKYFKFIMTVIEIIIPFFGFWKKIKAEQKLASAENREQSHLESLAEVVNFSASVARNVDPDHVQNIPELLSPDVLTGLIQENQTKAKIKDEVQPILEKLWAKGLAKIKKI